MQKNCDLVRVDLPQDKQVERLVKLKTSAGSYVLVLRSRGGEEVLCDAVQTGESALYLRCGDAAFDSFDILVKCLELEEFP